MAYTAIVARVNVRNHPNADKLAIGECNGIQVIVGKDTPDGTLGLYFDSDGVLSEQFCAANNLIRVKNADGSHSGGMFDTNRRVRAMNLRGVKSHGFWCELDYLIRTGVSTETVNSLKEGDTFDTLGGKLMNKRTRTFIDMAVSPMNRKERAKEYLENAIGDREIDDMDKSEIVALLERAVEIALEDTYEENR